MRKCLIGATLLSIALGSPATAQKPAAPKSSAKKIASALSAAPREVAAHAAVAEFGADGKMVTLREGSNGWVCMPDSPATPGPDPICVDKVWQGWTESYVAKKAPETSQIGIAYMLAGGADASNTDPFAEKPAAGDKWVRTGPHLMVLLPDTKMLESYSGEVSASGPYIMWKGTPYAHLMVPVAKPK